ncbi:MAG: hypothetical protein AAF488_03055 [Planctomycetota bacterium]
MKSEALPRSGLQLCLLATATLLFAPLPTLRAGDDPRSAIKELNGAKLKSSRTITFGNGLTDYRVRSFPWFSSGMVEILENWRKAPGSVKKKLRDLARFETKRDGYFDGVFVKKGQKIRLGIQGGKQGIWLVTSRGSKELRRRPIDVGVSRDPGVLFSNGSIVEFGTSLIRYRMPFLTQSDLDQRTPKYRKVPKGIVDLWVPFDWKERAETLGVKLNAVAESVGKSVKKSLPETIQLYLVSSIRPFPRISRTQFGPVVDLPSDTKDAIEWRQFPVADDMRDAWAAFAVARQLLRNWYPAVGRSEYEAIADGLAHALIEETLTDPPRFHRHWQATLQCGRALKPEQPWAKFVTDASNPATIALIYLLLAETDEPAKAAATILKKLETCSFEDLQLNCWRELCAVVGGASRAEELLVELTKPKEPLQEFSIAQGTVERDSETYRAFQSTALAPIAFANQGAVDVRFSLSLPREHSYELFLASDLTGQERVALRIEPNRVRLTYVDDRVPTSDTLGTLDMELITVGNSKQPVWHDLRWSFDRTTGSFHVEIDGKKIGTIITDKVGKLDVGLRLLGWATRGHGWSQYPKAIEYSPPK